MSAYMPLDGGHGKPLGERLIQKKLISRPQLQKALRKQESCNLPLGKILVDLGVISEAKLMSVLSEHLRLPAVSLKDIPVDMKAIKLVPKQVAERFSLVPVRRQDNVLTLVMDNPQDLMAVDTIQLTTGCEVKRVLGRLTEIKQAIREYYVETNGAEKTEPRAESAVHQGWDPFEHQEPVDAGGEKEGASSNYDSKGLQQLLKTMVDKGASDLYLSAGQPPYIRVNGELSALKLPRLDANMIERLISFALTPRGKEIFEERKSYDFSFKSLHLGRFRINICQQSGSYACAIRHITRKIPEMDKLGIPAVAHTFLSQPGGLLLVTGPNGSGKSTTLAAMIEYLNRQKRCRIITIEDPIEYAHVGNQAIIQQREFGHDTPSFAEAVRQTVRQDPDVVMVGEMRDLETMKATLTLAEAGYLVISTLHTPNTVHAISRIVDAFPPDPQVTVRVQLAGVLVGVIAQQLVTAKEKGRVLATEVLSVNTAIRSLIRQNNLHQIYNVIETHREDGMYSMDQCLLELYEKGKISKETLHNKIRDRSALKS